MKVKTTLYIYLTQYDWEDQPRYDAFTFESTGFNYQTFICKQEVELEIPDNFDPRPQKIAALEDKKLKVMAEHENTIKKINDRISKLKALEYRA
jgi:hypothetical protein